MVRFAFLMILMFSSATAFAMTKAASLTALGEEQMATGLFEAAVETFGQLARAKPEDVEVQTRLGYAYLKAKNYEAAEEAFKAAKPHQPRSTWTGSPNSTRITRRPIGF